jgi:hypothetical protein
MDQEQLRMRDALWSVYFKAADRSRSVLPPAVRPLRLEHALDILIDHKDQHGGARRRRAVFELAAAGLHDTVRARPAVARRVKRLATDLGVEHILDRVQRPADIGHAAQGLLAAPPRGTDCVSLKTRRVKVNYDPPTHASTITATILVNKPLDQMVPFIDPRRWTLCSDFFERSDAVDPRTPDYDPIVLGDPPTGRWQLYERFVVPIGAFENVLNIEFMNTGNEIQVRYGLYDSVSFELLGLELAGALEVDQGSVTAVRWANPPTWTEMTVVKTVVFRDLTPDDPAEGGIDQGQWLNYCAPAMLGLWMDDTSQARLCCRHAAGG